ncbi:MAG: hypothetical protein RL199_541 [Pseudomonadota bacterium]|jgi:hypothetical protein
MTCGFHGASRRHDDAGRFASRAAGLAAVLLASCSVSGPPEAMTALSPALGSDGPAPCTSPLSLTASSSAVLPYDLRILQAAGGTGAYRFRVVENASGASVNELSGAYLSGGTLDVSDVLAVTDAACAGEARLSLRVVAAMVVRPASVAVRPGRSFQVDVTRGSGRFSFTLAGNASGATLDAGGRYTAGLLAGRDILTVRDEGTGTVASVVVDIGPAEGARASPRALALPVGARLLPTFAGGSGVVDFDPSKLPAFLSLDDGWLVGRGPGRAVLSGVDRFTGDPVSLTVHVAAPQTTPTARVGDSSGVAAVANAGDLDGDGLAEAVVGVQELDVGGYDSGAVVLYRGTRSGLDPKPVQTFTATKGASFGRSLLVADFDKDGHPDLVVGADNADAGGVNSGAVSLYRGMSGGFEAVPESLPGRTANDRYGSALAACDFDGDGWLDLAVGAPNAEDAGLVADASPPACTLHADCAGNFFCSSGKCRPPGDYGAVFFHLGGPLGLPARPDGVVYGAWPKPGSGSVGPFPTLGLGWTLAAGDVDGDGLCDLVAGGRGALPVYSPADGSPVLDAKGEYTTRSNDGFVALLRGKRTTELDRVPVESMPARLWANVRSANSGTFFGLGLDVGDLDGDGDADVAVGQLGHDATGKANVGAARVWRGGPVSPTLVVEAAESSEWLFEGLESNDELGAAIVMADATGDGRADLLVGSRRTTGAAAPAPSRTGSVLLFPGRARDGTGPRLPDTVESRRYWAGQSQDWFGIAFDVLPDLDGGGVPELVALAPLADALGWDVGRPWYHAGEQLASGAPRRPPSSLQLPGGPSNSQVGRGVAVVGDVDGDGLDDLFVGAPNADVVHPANYLSNAGLGWVFRGTATGFEPSPMTSLGAFTLKSGSIAERASDQLGWGAAGLGDFDGDGAKDFAVLLRSGDRLSNPSPASDWFVPCPAIGSDRNDAGAVLVFRGRGDGLPPDPRPAFVWYGPEANARLDAVAGGFDLDGDGRGDFAVSSTGWKGGGSPALGGLAIVKGRPADPQGRLTVICDAVAGDLSGDVVQFLGSAASDNFGLVLAGLGDLDADGCGDVAVGARTEDFGGVFDRGGVHVLFGWGGARCPAAPRWATFSPEKSSMVAGGALAAGDVDGDGVVDLAVGGWSANANNPGYAWLLPGSWMKAAPTSPSATPTDAAAAWPKAPVPASPTPMSDPSGPKFLFTSPALGESYGAAVAVLPASSDAPGALAVGAPWRTTFGTFAAGAVDLFAFDRATGRFAVELPARVGGETNHGAGQFGAALGAVRRPSGRPLLVVGASESDGRPAEDGAVFAFDVGTLP